MKRLTTLLLMLFGASACIVSEGPNPEDVPEKERLVQGAEPVLLVGIRVTDAPSYDLIKAEIVLGTPTLAIVQSRDVLIEARDANGHLIESITISNPLEVRLEGPSQRPAPPLSEATVTARLPRPRDIASIDITVRSGVNEGYRTRWDARKLRLGGP